MFKTPEEEFGEHFASAIGAYQMLEEMLKNYIDISFRIVRLRVGKDIPFKFSGDDYRNAPLERLISIFEKLSDNSALVAKLNKIKEDRNYVAHKAFLAYAEKSESPDAHKGELDQIVKMREVAWGCVHEVMDGTRRLVALVK